MNEAHDGFQATVQRDQTFSCHCPTLELLTIYELLIEDLFTTVGWPSWQSVREQ